MSLIFVEILTYVQPSLIDKLLHVYNFQVRPPRQHLRLRRVRVRPQHESQREGNVHGHKGIHKGGQYNFLIGLFLFVRTQVVLKTTIFNRYPSFLLHVDTPSAFSVQANLRKYGHQTLKPRLLCSMLFIHAIHR